MSEWQGKNMVSRVRDVHVDAGRVGNAKPVEAFIADLIRIGRQYKAQAGARVTGV